MKGCVLTSLIHMHCSPFPTQLGEETIFFLLYIFISMVARLLSLVTNPHPEVVWEPQESLITITQGWSEELMTYNTDTPVSQDIPGVLGALCQELMTKTVCTGLCFSIVAQFL